MQRYLLTAACGLALLLAGCGSDEPPDHGRHIPPGAAHSPDDGVQRKAFHPPSEMIKKYDANGDGTITQDEMRSVLRKEFAAADTNHDGVLDENEARAVNEERWKEFGSATTPIIDFNQDGHIDFNEFAGAMFALFGQFDRNGDGILEPNEINPQPPRGKRDQTDHDGRGADGRQPPPQQ